MISSDNYSVFGIHNTAERYSWAAFHIFVLLSSLAGDSLILYATFQRSAFKLNKFIVIIIQYIAVTDLILAITTALPGAVSLIANTWVLGDVACYARIYLTYFIYPSGMFLIAVLTTSKWLLLKYPTRTVNWTKSMAHRVCCLAFIPSFITTIIIPLVIDMKDVSFTYIVYSCYYGFTAHTWKILVPITSIVTILTPNIVIVATTIPTLKYLYSARRSARRAGGSVPWQGTVTVALTAVVYCISTLPMFIYYIGKNFDTDPKGPFNVYYRRIAYFAFMINIMSNFYIYTMAIRSFRRFLFSKILCNLLVFSRISINRTSSTGKN